MEFLVCAAFEKPVQPSTSGPKINLLEKFLNAWPKIHHQNFEPGILDPAVDKHFPTNIRNEIISIIMDQIANKVDSSRHDYVDFLKLSLLFLGEEISNYKIIQPGACSNAK